MRRAAPLLVALALVAACGPGGGNDARSEAAADDTTAAAPPATAEDGGGDGSAAQARRGVRLEGIGRFDLPLYVTSPPQDRRRLFVVEQAGRIVVVRGGRKLAEPFLDIRDQVTSGGEQGLLSVAFAPDYASSGRFYVYFTDRSRRQRIVEYRRDTEDRADPGSARVVLVMDDPQPNHNGGLLLFGPDGLLYVGTGDGGSGDDPHGPRGNGQSLGTLLGKLLRIDPRASGGRPYRVPASNPFVGRAGARGEIYSYGLRNPWRFSFDRSTGDLTIADVGQDTREEVDFVRRGRGRAANFGWRPFEGTARNFDEPAPGHVPPLIEHTHGEGWCSITGGYVVRDSGLPALRGRYVYGDLCEGRVRAATLRAGRRTSGGVVPGLKRISALASFGEDAAGRVYAVSLAGPVYRLTAR